MDTLRSTDAAVLLLVLVLVWTLYRAQRNPDFNFDLFDLLMQHGRVSRLAFAFMATLGVTSWIMVRLTIDGKLTEGYLTAYGIMWVAPVVAKMFSTPPPLGTMTVVDTKMTTQIAEAAKETA